MMLNRLETGSLASAFRGSREEFVVSRGRSPGRSQSIQVRASSGGDPAGWLQTASKQLGKLSSFGEKRKTATSTSTRGPSGDNVQYTGVATTMKKLKVLDLIDRVADIQDDTSEIVGGKRVTVQLVSKDVDPKTGESMKSSEVIFPNWAGLEGPAASLIDFVLEFTVPKSFGVPGAILVKNAHPNEFLLVSFELELHDKSKAHYVTNSWVYNTEKTGARIFFQNTAYLPDETPASLKALREQELINLRGDGTGERQIGDRIYDYAVYNDLGNIEQNEKFERPNLGGNDMYHFPRRMRTGRRNTTVEAKKFPGMVYETRKTKGDFYIPRDEAFERAKMSDFLADGFRSIGHSVSSKVTGFVTRKQEFDTVEEIKKLYAKKGEKVGGINNVLPDKEDIPEQEQYPLVFLQEVLKPDGKMEHPLLYPLPQLLQADDTSWRSNDEFAREFLAGLNPVMITRVKEFPIRSSLDPAEFGDPTSAISKDHIEGSLEGLSVEEAVTSNRLFVVDYHDAFLPFVAKINAQQNSATYATRTLLFLSKDGILKLLAIELALPPKTVGEERITRVLTTRKDDQLWKVNWEWELAKAHVSNNDITAHQVFSHFSRCHAVTEAVIICSNRNLSKLHPLMQLLAPHFKSTLEINRQARATLIAAGGSIETHFTTRAYSLEMAAVNYKDTWTFESQALPTDLVARGMAVPDPDSPHGVRLVVEDYPYAADGLELWGALKAWHKEYVDIYYKDDAAVLQDSELMTWWTEMREKAHEDKKDSHGWPELNSKEALVDILTTVIWIPSCQHAAVNFGQYDFAGFMPHHPTLTRRLLPEHGNEKDKADFNKNPEKYYLTSISNIDSTTTAMSVYEVLSAHCPIEEYIGERRGNWTNNEKVLAAFKGFKESVNEADAVMRARNADPKLKNRGGPVKMPYQLLRPHSKPGVTSMGVPNSITI